MVGNSLGFATKHVSVNMRAQATRADFRGDFVHFLQNLVPFLANNLQTTWLILNWIFAFERYFVRLSVTFFTIFSNLLFHHSWGVWAYLGLRAEFWRSKSNWGLILDPTWIILITNKPFYDHFWTVVSKNSCLTPNYQNWKNCLKLVKIIRISTIICMQVDTYETQILTKFGVMGTYV